ncbi:MAG: hypothetical protein HN467_12190 [Opitutae bacterium]|nr:hypothetical protein [Opitutae bacterium]
MKSSKSIPAACLFLLGAAYVTGFFYIHSAKDFWLDEIFTHYQVSNHGFGSLCSSFHAGVNSLPPAYFLVLWFQETVFGDGSFSFRFPSLFFSLISILYAYKCLYLFFDRPTSTLTVLTIFCFAVELHQQTVEARPYAMYFMVSVLSIYCWCRLIQDVKPSGKLLSANAALAFLLPFTHYYGGLYNGLLLASICFVDRSAGRLRVKVYLSFLFGWVCFCMLGLQVFLSQMSIISNKAEAGLLLTENHLIKIFNLYGNFILFPLPLLVLLAIYLFLHKPADTDFPCSPQNNSPSILMAMSLWLLVPGVLVLLAKFKVLEVAANVKYFLPTVMALAFFIAHFIKGFLGRFRDADIPRMNRYLIVYTIFCLGFFALNSHRFTKAFRDFGIPNYYATVFGEKLPIFVNDNTAFYHLSYFSNSSLVYRITRDSSFVQHMNQFSSELKTFNYEDDTLKIPELLFVSVGKTNAEESLFLDFIENTHSMVEERNLDRHRVLKFLIKDT